LNIAVQPVDENLVIIPAARPGHVTLHPGRRTDPACLNVLCPTLDLPGLGYLVLVIDLSRDQCILRRVDVAPSGHEELGEVVAHWFAGCLVAWSCWIHCGCQ
jgi:hypothetical protein